MYIKHFSLLIIALCQPFVFWAVIYILPTFDDFTTLQSPQFTSWLSAEDLLPNGSFWRPWDYLFGCLLGRFPSLFPTLNHLLILLGHSISAVLVFRICTLLKVGQTETNISTLFFFFSPAALGATLACDGLNQTYAQLWGLLALWCYLKEKYLLWPLLVAVAALSKENGLSWAIVPPIVAYAFSLINIRKALRHCGIGFLLVIVYFTARLCLSVSDNINNEYTDATMMSHVNDFVQLMAYTWIPLDYMSVVYAPSRNLAMAVITVLFTLPFLVLLASRWRLLLTRRLLLLVACFFILVSPHLITLVSIMHNYAALSIAAIIMATLLSGIKPHYYYLFILYLSAALFTDVHHCLAARESGLLGKRLAMQAIEAADKPIERAFVINIDNPDEPRYSSFCVRPVDAFAWGLSVRHYTGYAWPAAITEASLPAYDDRLVEALADSALHSRNDIVWVVGHSPDSIKVLRH